MMCFKDTIYLIKDGHLFEQTIRYQLASHHAWPLCANFDFELSGGF